MPIKPNETRVWVGGLPKSSQSKDKIARAYAERIREAARAKFPLPLTTPVEVTIVFADWSARPDVDNVDKRVIDALKGVAFIDDRQVKKVTIAVVDQTIAVLAGNDHQTFQQLLKGDQFLIRIFADPLPTITWDVESS